MVVRVKMACRANLVLALRANSLARHGRLGRKVAKAIKHLNRMLFACDIGIGARIDPGCRFPHLGLEYVISGNSAIEADCCIFQNVTISAANKGGVPDSGIPHIGRNVPAGAGAIPPGDIEIGGDSLIGANAVVTKPVPPVHRCRSSCKGHLARAQWGFR